MLKRVIRQLANVVMPAAIFYAIYSSAGIIAAMIASLLFSAFNAIYTYINQRQIPNTQLFGLIGLGLSTIGILFTSNEKLYYVPSLVSNAVFFCFSAGLTLRRKSIFHYVTKEFHIASLVNISEDSLFSVNMVWLMFFLLKILSKALGILFLNFDQLYWLVFLLGDPMTLAVVAYSIYQINKAPQKEQSVSGDEQGA